MQVLLLYYSPWWNASAYYGVMLARGLQNAGHTVWFGTDKNVIAGKTASEKGVQVFNSKLKTINPIKVALEAGRLAQFIAREKIDIVNTLSPQGHLLHFLAQRIFGIKTPLVRTCCDSRKPKSHRLNKYLYSRCVDWLIFPCKSNFERYYEVLNFPPQKTSIVYGPIDINDFDHNKPEHFLRKKYNISSKTPVVGIVARLSPEKGHRFFLHVAAKVAAKVKKVCFVIVGKEEQVSSDSLRELAANLGIGDKVIFTGYIDDPRAVIEEFTIGVIASRFSETVSRAALEFMSSARPVISTNVNVLAEIIRPGKTGLVYEVDDVNRMAQGIIDLLKNREKCQTWGSNGRHEILDNYTIETCTEDTLKVYRAVLDGEG